MEAPGSLVKTKQRQECWWGLHLYPGLSLTLSIFLFALLHPRNLPEGPSAVEAFSSSLDVHACVYVSVCISVCVCGVDPTVAWTFKHLHFLSGVHVHTRTHLNWVFVTFSCQETPARHVPSRAKPSEKTRLCFCTCHHSGGNIVTCSLLWNWNWHLALHCSYQVALMFFQKGRCVCVCACACMHVCVREWAQCYHLIIGTAGSLMSVFFRNLIILNFASVISLFTWPNQILWWTAGPLLTLSYQAALQKPIFLMGPLKSLWLPSGFGAWCKSLIFFFFSSVFWEPVIVSLAGVCLYRDYQ